MHEEEEEREDLFKLLVSYTALILRNLLLAR